MICRVYFSLKVFADVLCAPMTNIINKDPRSAKKVLMKWKIREIKPLKRDHNTSACYTRKCNNLEKLLVIIYSRQCKIQPHV